jgi:lipopolysaccharide export system permease protein
LPAEVLWPALWPYDGGEETFLTRFARTLSIYIGWQFITSFFAFLAGIAGLILLFDTIELLRRSAGNESIGFGTVFGLALLKLPHTAQATLPFVIMLSMMFALFKLSRSRELLVIRSAGVSAWQFLAPPLILALALGWINLMLVDPFAANLYESYQRLEDELIRHNAPALNMGRTGLWMREAQGTEATILHAGSVRQEGGVLILGDVSVFQLNNEKLHSRFEATGGQLLEGFLKLDGAWNIQPGPTKTATYYTEYFLPTTLTANQVQDSFAAPETMSFWDLPEFIRTHRAAGFAALPHRLYWQSLLASPFLLCAMVLVASSFYLTMNFRLAAWALRGAAGIGTGFVLYFFNHFTYALGLSATLPLMLAAWAPTIVTAMFGLAYLFHREDG